MPKITATITEEQAHTMQRLVDTGDYADTDEVLAAALDELGIRYRLDHPDETTVQRLRSLWEEGIASGSAGPADFDELLQEARQESQESLRRTA